MHNSGISHYKLKLYGQDKVMEILLFVNDNILIRSSFQNYLESVGYKVDACTDGKEALSKFEENEYDLVLLDMNLPSISGVDLIKSIREINAAIPILVFCTIEYDCNSVQQYVQGFFNQSTSERELVEKIKVAIEKSKGTDATG